MPFSPIASTSAARTGVCEPAVSTWPEMDAVPRGDAGPAAAGGPLPRRPCAEAAGARAARAASITATIAVNRRDNVRCGGTLLSDHCTIALDLAPSHSRSVVPHGVFFF